MDVTYKEKEISTDEITNFGTFYIKQAQNSLIAALFLAGVN